MTSATTLRIVNTRSAERWAVMETGLALHNAHEELGASAFWEMVRNDLNFSKGTVSKLIAIGTDAKLLEVSPGKLPANWTMLYSLTTLTDEQFQKGLRDKVINVRMARKDVAKLKPPPRERRGQKAIDLIKIFEDFEGFEGWASQALTVLTGSLAELQPDEQESLLFRLRDHLDTLHREVTQLRRDLADLRLPVEVSDADRRR